MTLMHIHTLIINISCRTHYLMYTKYDSESWLELSSEVLLRTVTTPNVAFRVCCRKSINSSSLRGVVPTVIALLKYSILFLFSLAGSRLRCVSCEYGKAIFGFEGSTGLGNLMPS